MLVGERMTRNPVTVRPEDSVTDVRELMRREKVTHAAVLDKQRRLVGVLTETDLFKLFVELFGARQKGLRLTVRVPERRGELAELTSAICREGGNIIAIGTFLGEDPDSSLCTVKVDGIRRDDLVALIELLVLKIIDIRET